MTRPVPDKDSFDRVRKESTEIVRRCKPFDRTPGKRTGLVVGYVQSGKTMSMTTVACIARDSGCRIVVLLAGVTTNLLRQNASRFRDTLRAAADGREDWLIINSEDGRKGSSEAQTVRQAVQEWRDQSIPPTEQRTLFLAVLKNHSHLDWVAGLLEQEKLADIPALILDDEADQAGLNVGTPDDPSTTYLRIARIRKALPNHTYIQYTATPQAPLLISIDDMLSPEFAELVEPGTGYTGGLTFFPPRQPHPHIRIIGPDEQFVPGTLTGDDPPQLLKDALATFFVGSAIARLRGKPRRRSMLIHPSQRNDDQAKFLQWTMGIQKRWTTSLAANDQDDRADTLTELRRGYDDLLKTDHALPPYVELEPYLKLSLARTSCKKVNSEDGSEVDWDNFSDHILVGGEKLNRGYTVEGLTVTYMPRGSGGWNADTIQQRARFFGYKQSYLSLCRVYLHPDVHDAFTNYVQHEMDVRRQLKEHRGKPLREWRRAFFLDAKMRPTRSNVLSEPLVRVTSDREWFVQRYPHVDQEAIDANDSLVKGFLAAHPMTAKLMGRIAVEVSLDVALRDLLLDFRVPQESASWYAHLVTLSNASNEDPRQRVTFVYVDTNGEARKRSADQKTNAITLHQGRSSASNSTDNEGSDKELRASGNGITIQIHHVKAVTQAGDVRELHALAVFAPKQEDAIASGG